ncbi:hypothetical protein CC1G_13091 [Coprinopsis cinerea okayama7|uniref:CxC2-like cysteine cluster KDZ transposase-associated domain-containing protein n=1 Tax=Coprinopsis cinerea (strain Okayama-7 / 130 / ATCC MYA-4618 / FGSC 9003) TaxID=240176 RepID=A8NZ98_COPC7|nr:hypothetical protein CC1G_13091 [Coprinopsis cinerea okayama7\|eukprot:XP_001837636.2 hypothetical protein CC1G_13091 [Coprinopsis cinerea okayama7\
MGFGSSKNVTGLQDKRKVRSMEAKLVWTKGGKPRMKLVPNSVPSPIKSTPSPSKRRRVEDDSPDEDDNATSYVSPFQPHPQHEEEDEPRTKDSNDYMTEWFPKRSTYLQEIIHNEAPSDDASWTCSVCSTSTSQEWWRCKTCVAFPILCGHCVLHTHSLTPFHRVETWCDGYFRPSWLWKAGVSVSLCATGVCDVDAGMDLQESCVGEESTDPGEVKTGHDAFTFDAAPPGRTYRGMKVLVVVHSNGVHHLPFRFCDCIDSPFDEYQLLRAGFYPSTSTDVRTVFTFALLDEFLLDGVECFTSAHHFYSKLKRLTNEPFPDTVPNRVRELRRVGRQWRSLKELKRHGFGHSGTTPGKGELALFCAACPQPGVNLPQGWENDKDQWKYTRSFVADGNFTCIHRKQRERGENEEEVALKLGEGYMVDPVRYAEHLSTAKEVNETATCHEHRAIADKSKVRKGLDVTGIGAIACMRHGAFAPGSVVDFQKGERQINMDYSLSEALKYTSTAGTKRVIFAYDINCQYSKHLLGRLEKGDYLELREDLVFVFGIGLFHVHGHQESCHARYSLTFIEGAGNSSGEILESLWAVVNEVARSTSTMTLAHRTEVLDAIFGDINWKKLLNSVPSICKNWLNSRKQMAIAKEDLALLSETATPEQIRRWKSQLEDANRRRASDISAMDILNAKIVKPPTLSKTRTRMMEDEKQSGTAVGVTSWIAFGLKIQETQIVLKSFVRGLPKDMTEAQELELAKRREQLYLDIDSFYENASHLFPDADLDTLKCDDPPSDEVALDDDVIEDAEENPFSLSQNEVEIVRLPLPSSLSSSTMEIAPGIQRAQRKELKLRISQADDALESIRNEIGHKSYLFRSNIRLAQGKKQKTRGYTAVKSVNSRLRDHVKVYNQARWALRRLGAEEDILRKYKAITAEDTRAVTTIYKPNERGQRNKPLSWIWNLNVADDSSKSEYMEELYRVNWLRAKSRFDRWKEEHTLLTCEMDWVLNFFAYKIDQCETWALTKPDSPGHVAYANRQGDMWKRMLAHATKMFKKTRESVLSTA